MNKKRIIVLVFFLLAFLIIVLFPYKEEKKYSSKSKKPNVLGIIKKDDDIIQNFKTKKQYNCLGFRFANYQTFIKKGNILITIINNSNKKEYVIKEKLKNLTDNGVFYINYNIKKNNEYSIKIKNDSNYNITIYTTYDDDNNTKLYLNNELMEEDLMLYYKFNLIKDCDEKFVFTSVFQRDGGGCKPLKRRKRCSFGVGRKKNGRPFVELSRDCRVKA